MQKWEYKVVYIDKLTPDQINPRFNNLGQEGWELVSGPTSTAWGALFIFKRPSK